ncbi:MAG: hypothetical protein AAFQ50_11795, partial [Pseudomonadota bacterium]
MMFDFLSVAMGLVILIFAGDALVKGAVNLALRVGLSALVVSLTVVAFGTPSTSNTLAVFDPTTLPKAKPGTSS